MADNAIAAQVDVNPLKTYGQILGVQQQATELAQRRQQLQTGGYVQRTAEAESVMRQQQAHEMQAGAQLLADPVGNGLVDADGNPTMDAYPKIKAAMPTTGDSHYKNLLEAATSKIQLRTAGMGLDNETRNMVASRIAGVAADQNATIADVLNALDETRENFKGSSNAANVNKIADIVATGIGKVAGENKGKDGKLADKTRQYLFGLSRSGLGNAGITGAGGIAAPGNVIADVGGQLLPGTQAPALQGGVFNPSGQVVQKTLAPGQLPSYLAQAAAASTTGGGLAHADVSRSEQISQSVQPSRQAVTLADQISNLADQVHTGKFSKTVTDYMAAAGQNDPVIAARQLMSKYAAQLKTVAIANAPTDTARNQIDAGFPDPEHMSPEAIKGASEYIKGSMLMNLSRAKLAREYALKRGGDTSGLRYADDQLTQTADPLMYTYQNLKPGAERQEFIRRHFKSKEQAAEFKQRMNAVEHYGGLQQ